ncbi:uncharacterized protein LOC131680472 [Topomyia yanbarensis]|uniref:uncharacterized protein LOC131680472 n=1 Tax=Topomyia yanbarensis TaxID=2498891 RepID=UPI00273A961D|nr:uncharacterized protein LOC131680472 [Topomyia yanbarensis]
MDNAAKKRRVPHSEEVIKRCLDAISNGTAIKTACRLHGIPRSTIKFRLSKHYKHQPRPGPAPALNQADELELPESVTKASANVTESDIRKWFKEVLGILHEEKVADILSDPRRILNGDEACFYLDPMINKVIARRGERNVYKVDQGPAKKNITVMFTCSADGVMFPPMIVLPYKKIPMEVTKSVPAEWGLGKTDNGWMNKECFLKYIKHILHPQLVKANLLPVIYFVDGHSSHTPWETAEECSKLGIILICLYANCTRILQPLDVAVFKPLKTAWLKVTDDWKISNPNQHVKTENFSCLLEKAMESIDDRIIGNGFKACGLFPFDENSVDYSKCLARNSSNIDQNNPQHGNCHEMNVSAVSSSKTFPVSHADAQEVLDMMGRSRRIRYREGNDMYSMSEEDQILAKVYNIFKPMDVVENQTIEEHFIEDQSMTEERTSEMHVEEDFQFEFVKIDELCVDNLSGTSQQSNGKSELAKFLESPETPKRTGTLRFKRRSPAVLTSRRRLEYHKAKAEEKRKVEEEKQRKAELRKKNKKPPRKHIN